MICNVLLKCKRWRLTLKPMQRTVVGGKHSLRKTQCAVLKWVTIVHQHNRNLYQFLLLGLNPGLLDQQMLWSNWCSLFIISTSQFPLKVSSDMCLAWPCMIVFMSWLDLSVARQKWNMILNDTSSYFQKMKGTPGYEQTSCISLFYDSFYSRLFDVHPVRNLLFMLINI